MARSRPMTGRPRGPLGAAREGSLPVLAAVGICLGMLLPGCMAESEKGAGAGDGKGLSGVLVDAGGRPLSGAKVKAIRPDEEPSPAGIPLMVSAAADSVFSDEDGRYRFPALPAGEYNLLGTSEDGALVGLIKGVDHEGPAGGNRLGTDTLRAPGLVRGKVEGAGAPLAGALCYLPGTSYVAVSGDSGEFLLPRVPPGLHALKYSSPGHLRAADTIRVTSGRVTEVSTRRLDADTAGPPTAPGRLEVRYDTLRALVVLDWKPVAGPDIAGYLVFRGDGSGIDSMRRVSSPSFTDSIRPLVEAGREATLVYRVKTVDSDANPSLVGSPLSVVRAVHPWDFMGITSVRLSGAEGGGTTIGDTLKIRVAFRASSRMRGLRLLHRYSKGSWTVVSQGRSLPDTDGEETLAWSTDSAGRHGLQLDLEHGSEAFDTRAWEFDVLDTPPEAQVAHPEAARAGDTVEVTGAGSRDTYGRIVKWEWDIGGTGTWTAGGPTLTFRVPEGPDGVLAGLLKVTDDDGREDTKEFRIRILP